jgi:TonB family protein
VLIMRLLPLMLLATALAAQDPVDLQGWMDRGIQEFKVAHYPEAVAAFERAASIDPSNLPAQLYLGTAYMQQFIPGVESPDNIHVAQAARTHFQRVLQLEPSNKVALASMGSLLLNQKKWDEAQQWYEKLTAADPYNADAYYSMGFIAWARWYADYSKARTALGMRPEDPGPIKDATVRADLTARYGAVLDSGLRALQKALEINPKYDDAMAYMNLLIRERGDLRETAIEWKQDVAVADDWVQKALATKKAKAEQQGAANGMMPTSPPPPPQRIKISRDVVQRQLVRDVRPVYPELAKQARVQGIVQLSVVISKQGRVMDIKVISGHPLLITAAIEAVKQWEYNPTLLNGQPVEVATEVSVPFVL